MRKIVLIFVFMIVVLSNSFLVQSATYPFPIVGGDSVIVTNTDSSEEKELWSEKQLCKFVRGCLEEDFCYPFGYIRDEQYCGIYYISSFEKFGFINQSKSEENCTYDFQCKSNFCFEGECVSSIESLTPGLKEKVENLGLTINEIEKENSFSNEDSFNETPLIESEDTTNKVPKKTNWIKKLWSNIFN